MTAPQPPGGIYWRAVLFAPFTINLPVQVGMGAALWPNVVFTINLPVQVGMSSPVGLGINLPLFVSMRGKPSATVEFAIAMPIQVAMSTHTPFAINMPITVGMEVDAIVHGRQLSTAVQRAATI